MKKIVSLLIVSGVILFSTTAFAAKTHTFREGDTLWELAAKHYGDPTLYPVLLEVNGIDNPRTIQNGKVIIIPDKDDMRRIANENDPEKKKELIASATGSSNVPPQGDPNDSDKPQSPDQVSRTGDAIDPEETGFTKILAGPKVTADKLIKTTNP